MSCGLFNYVYYIYIYYIYLVFWWFSQGTFLQKNPWNFQSTPKQMRQLWAKKTNVCLGWRLEVWDCPPEPLRLEENNHFQDFNLLLKGGDIPLENVRFLLGYISC